LDFEAAVDLLLALNVAKRPEDKAARRSGSAQQPRAASMVAMRTTLKSSTIIEGKFMAPIAHPGRLLKREITGRRLSANRLALAIGVPSGRITDILNGRRSISADTAVRLGRYFGNRPQFWMDLQAQYDISIVERDRGREIARRIQPASAA
jgi:addiction module HigA family antidote